MTETQAQSGTAGASTNPGEPEAGGAAEAAAASAADRSTGRAAVPTDARPSAPVPGSVLNSTGRLAESTTTPPEPSAPTKPDARPDGAAPSGGGTGSSAKAASSGGSPWLGGASGAAAAKRGGEPRVGPPSPAAPAGGGAAAGRAPGVGSTVGTASVPGAAGHGSATARTQAIRPSGMAPPPSTAGMPTGTSRVSQAVRAARAAVSGTTPRGPRRARLFVKRIDPWSVMKFSFAVAVVLFFVGIIATTVLYLALDAMGVFDSVNKALSDMVGAAGSSKTAGLKITFKGVFFASAVLGFVNVVLFTALATLGAFVYNVCSDLVGGIEVTLSEKD